MAAPSDSKPSVARKCTTQEHRPRVRCVIVLRPMSEVAARALTAGEAPPDVTTADDYPTEFSLGMAPMVGAGSPLGPWLMHRLEDEVVVGDIGGGFIAPRVAEIGYAVVRSCWGRGYATAAVSALVDSARRQLGIDQLVGHTPLDRPASGRVLAHCGFVHVGEVDDEHDGNRIRVQSGVWT